MIVVVKWRCYYKESESSSCEVFVFESLITAESLYVLSMKTTVFSPLKMSNRNSNPMLRQILVILVILFLCFDVFVYSSSIISVFTIVFCKH